MLVEELASEWDAEKYTDDYRRNLLRIIEAEQKGREAQLEAEPEERNGNVVDLMERLRKSLEGTGARTSGRKAGGRKTGAARAAGAKKSKRTKRAA